MPALVLFQMQRFLSSENTDWPASSSSPICRQSMHTNATAPLRASAAACPRVRCRKRVKAATHRFELVRHADLCCEESEFVRRAAALLPRLMWFLGAGASRTAGMPTATDIIWDL